MMENCNAECELSYVDTVLKLIEDDYKNITVSDIVKKSYIDKDYLTRLFKQETGMTIKTYIIKRKIKEAKRLLSLGLSVKEASYMAGFRDYSNFCRIFKKYEGYPPSGVKEND